MRHRRLIMFLALVLVPGAVLLAATARLARQEWVCHATSPRPASRRSPRTRRGSGTHWATSSTQRHSRARWLRMWRASCPATRRSTAGRPATRWRSKPTRLGRRLFDGRARCSFCHRGPNFTDELFHNTGVAWRAGPPADSGRFAVTGAPRDIGAFKTPTLREIERTAPYMHDGSLAALEDVIDFYDRGGVTSGVANPGLDRELRPLGLSDAEKRALLAFLRTLTGRVREGGW